LEEACTQEGPEGFVVGVFDDGQTFTTEVPNVTWGLPIGATSEETGGRKKKGKGSKGKAKQKAKAKTTKKKKAGKAKAKTTKKDKPTRANQKVKAKKADTQEGDDEPHMQQPGKGKAAVAPEHDAGTSSAVEVGHQSPCRCCMSLLAQALVQSKFKL
jgi:hypothetical protein